MHNINPSIHESRKALCTNSALPPVSKTESAKSVWNPTRFATPVRRKASPWSSIEAARTRRAASSGVMKRKVIGPNATFSVVPTTLDAYTNPAPSAATCQRRLRSKIATRVGRGMGIVILSHYLIP